jgi:hypothetical protein
LQEVVVGVYLQTMQEVQELQDQVVEVAQVFIITQHLVVEMELPILVEVVQVRHQQEQVDQEL